MLIPKDGLVGKWSVHEVTKVFQGQDTSAVIQTLELLNSGRADIEELIGAVALSSGIMVEILGSGMMSMSIIQSMLLPNMPATMNMKASLSWELQGDHMFTQALTDTLEAKVTINPDYALSDNQLAELKQQIPGIAAQTLQGMKADSLWNNRNMVVVLYCGSRYFLTKNETGIMMLHQRIKTEVNNEEGNNG